MFQQTNELEPGDWCVTPEGRIGYFTGEVSSNGYGEFQHGEENPWTWWTINQVRFATPDEIELVERKGIVDGYEPPWRLR